MEPLSIDNAIYEEVDRSKATPATERFEVDINQCYAASNRETAVAGGRRCYKKVLNIIISLILVSALLLAMAGACVAFTLQITKLRSEITSLNYQLKQEFTALENRTQQLNTCTQMIFSVIEGPGGQFQFHPAVSCASLPPSSPSGYYWLTASNGSAVSVYCDMTRSCGGVTGGWMRVAELDMSNSSHLCPSGLVERNDLSKCTCIPISGSASCSSVTLPMSSKYSKVCGRIIAYQVGSPNTFAGFTGSALIRVNITIDTNYVDGVSLTHGSPRQHIWTFAAGLDEFSGSYANSNCPCTDTNQTSSATPPPDYVGGDYFCDTGSEGLFQNGRFYSDDPLWDGAGCGPLNACCSFNDPPWFFKQLPQPTTDDIEMRVCKDQSFTNEDIAVEVISIYVQ